ncbi:MAG TPA: hypothetical protein VJN95_05355 [Gemmatimonadales bacterium]|nr:hypothetical protein [Gemmatimonadales bacterium]
MSSDQPGGQLKPITPARLAQELVKLSATRRAEGFDAAAYDQRFARVIQELRERRIDGGRAEVHAALLPLVEQGTITRAEFDRVTKQLGMA